MSHKLFISAGEASGDRHGALLISNLRQEIPDLSFSGMLGPALRESQGKQIFPMEGLNVMGIGAVLKNLPRLWKLYNGLVDHILTGGYDTLVTIDAPDFHLKVARKLRKKGFKGRLVHLVCPSIWAWKPSRKQDLERDYDALLCIFPFEVPLFKDSRLTVRYFLNPSLQQFQKNNYLATHEVLALFPGSRPHVIKNNLPLQWQAAKNIAKTLNLPICISAVDTNHLPFIHKVTEGEATVDFDGYRLMRRAACAIATCGTVNLELALRGVPTVVTYPVNGLDALIGKLFLKGKLSHYSLPNILLKRSFFPEIIGKGCTASGIERAMDALLTHREQFLSDHRELMASLNAPAISPKDLVDLLFGEGHG